MAEVHVFTSAAANYLPKVRVLFSTLAEHHPQWRRHLVLVEDESVTVEPESVGAHEVHGIADLDIPQWRPWSFCHTLVELATAVKPFAMAKLLQREGAQSVVYLDPDTALFSPIGEVTEALTNASVVLTPHQLAPETRLGRVVDNEISSLRHGVYNLGFLAVAANSSGLAFSEWWCQRLYRFCRNDIPNGLFTDQRWIDLVPALFPDVGILRSPRLNVASWNLSQRSLSAKNGEFHIGDEPLGFYHFTSVSTASHALMALKNSDMPDALKELLQWYEHREREFSSTSVQMPWSLGKYRDGRPIESRHRRLYRDTPAHQARWPDPAASPEFAEFADRQLAVSEPEVEPENGAAKGFSVGFAAGDETVDEQKLARLLKAMLTDPRLAAVLTRRFLNVLASEGPGGVLRRLR